MDLISFLTRIAARFISTKSVDNIVSVLTTVADKLAAAEVAQNAKAEELSQRAKSFSALSDEAREAAERARRVRSNIQNITN